MKLKLLALASCAIMAATPASALSVVSNSSASALASALVSPGSGISIVGGSETYQGGATQGGTYSGFSLSNSTTTITLGDGVVLTSGDVGDIPGNDSTAISSNPGAGSDADLQSISAQTVTNDANVLSFDFTAAPGITSIDLDFVFASDEFPNQSVTDIFGVFVDGINYAFFPNGDLVNFTLGSANAGLFFDNDFGSADPFEDASGTALEYDGIYQPLSLTGILDMNLATHTIKIAIGDTNDTAFDSGVFITGLGGGTSTGGGGIDPTTVPLPASLPLLLVAVAGVGMITRRRSNA
ncbi:choice-of-anchor L domain-containing protein [Roseibium sp.]|uniref:choice-of-anchor L domain-containing protein n=1 Tax=Roseibium sp. TaxID=1936156 RepID=UPI003BA90447